ncbi:MAG: poly(3-hydroxybutyrate) depolymerase, partial [Pontibacterium sp.]
KNNVTLGYIDDTANVLDDKIYLFSGQSDETVQTGVVTTAVDFYKKLGVDETRIFYNKSVDAGHAFITDDNADTPCDETKAPYINYCNINQSYRILNRIYGSLNDPAPQTTGKLITFDQSEFFNSLLYPNVSMDDKAYVYVPEACESEQCRVHVAMHGCEQGTQSLGLEYVTETGYNNVADTNNIIVLYPQAKKSALNPKGCWDFWGYSNNNLPPFTYFTKSAPQMAAIKAMIDRVSQPK